MPLRTIHDRAAAFPVTPVGNRFTAGLYGGGFHLWRLPAGDLPAVSLVFVQSRDGNTGADNPADLGAGDTDKHLLYEGLSRVGADAVLSGAATASGPDVFFSVWHPEIVALRRGLGLPRHPAQVIVTGRGCIDVEQSLIFNASEVPVFVLGSEAACAAIASGVESRPWVRVVPIEPAGIRAALSRLRRDHGIARISAIGGRTTATTLVDAGAAQDLYLTTSGSSGGEPGTPWYTGSKPPALRRIVVKQGEGAAGDLLFEHLALSV